MQNTLKKQADRGEDLGPPLRESRWRRTGCIRRGHVPEDIWHWLVDRASLTQRIIQVCDGPFRVHVIHQGWSRPLLNESKALGARPEVLALVRQVYLYCGDTPWVYARTVIPACTLTGPEKRLGYLRSRSLGAALFSDPSMEREEVQITCLKRTDKLFRRATEMLADKPQCIWGRRSVFRLSTKPLLVSEFFLPAIGACTL